MGVSFEQGYLLRASVNSSTNFDGGSSFSTSVMRWLAGGPVRFTIAG